VDKEHLFISDIHIGAFDQETEHAIESDLIDLISYATEKEAQLYILGDLFDYWMEFPNSDYRPTIGKRVLEKFNAYNQTVNPAIFITGNHDNWTLGYFKECGFEVESEYQILELFNKDLLLMHGDGKVQEDKTLKRPLLHRILRNKIFLTFYRGILPKKTALQLMRSFSNTSRKINRQDSRLLNSNAEFIITQGISDIVLAGHDHIPRVETFNSGLYINLGTFFHHRTLVRGIDGVLSLVQWDAQKKQFNEFYSAT
jgi:UDP-2,3-diacylglucosamine pyrophosphatase LpxH